MFSFWLHHCLTLSTLWKEMKIAEKEGSLPVLDTDILNTSILRTAEITTWLTGKIGEHLPVAEGLNVLKNTLPHFKYNRPIFEMKLLC